jgi:hypothetical protein
MLDFADDDSLHQTGLAEEWRESFYCNFFDSESRFYGTVWQGVRPNQQCAEAVFLLFDRTETLIESVETKLFIPSDIGEERRALGHQRFECVEPWRHWRVHYDDGSSRLTIDWEQMSKICDWDTAEPTSNGPDPFLGAARHYEAAGRITVTGRVHGEDVSFTGFGERDRAWGPRNYGRLRFGWWQTIQFPDGEASHVFVVQDKGDEFKLYGFLHRDGETRQAVEYTCEAGYDGEGGPPVSSRQRLVDDAGRVLVIDSMTTLQVLSFATEADGSNIEERGVASDEEKAYHWTWQEFLRADGVVGRGMIDHNHWPGSQYASFSSTTPLGTLYDYGLVDQS